MDMDKEANIGSDRTNWGITTSLALAMLLASLGTSIANIALPALTDAFSAPLHQVQWVVIAYLATLTISVVIVGRLGDRYGLRRMLIAGLILFSLASLLCGFASNLWFLVCGRAVQGIGAAFLTTLAMALMRETVGEARIGRAMGLLGTVSALGTALGPSLGGILIAIAGWRSIFWIQIPPAVLALVLAFAALPRAAPKRDSISRIWTMPDRALVPSLVVNLLVAAVMMTTLVVGPFYLGRGLGLMEAMVGLVMAVGPVISIFSGVPSGRVVDAWGAQRVLAAGLGMLALGAFLMSILPQRVGVAGYVLAILVLTPGYQLFQAANNTAVLADVPKDRRGEVSGLLNLSRNLGLIVGASAMSAVFAFGVGTSDFAQASSMTIANGLQLTFMLATILVAMALCISFRYSLRPEAR